MLNKIYIKAESSTIPPTPETDYHYVISINGTSLGASEVYKGFPGIMSLNVDGTIDTSFTTVKSGGFYSTTTANIPLCSALQSDGKIIIGGSFTNFNGPTQAFIIRLNSNGTNDTSFSIGTGFAGQVNSIVIQPDGKILAGGAFNSYNGTSRNGLIRLNTDGSVDTSFSIGTGFLNSIGVVNVSVIALQSDGKILVGGDFVSYNGLTRNRLVRLNSDGSEDTSFVIGTGFNQSVVSIVEQTDGKILVAGNFFTFNGTTRNRIIRLNTDGSEDTSFVIGTGFNQQVNNIILLSDGKILAAGVFTTYNGTSRNRIIKLNTNGSEDTSFVIGTGFNSLVSSISLLSGGSILATGIFTSYNGIPVSNQICLINPDGTLNTIFNANAGSGIKNGANGSLYNLSISGGTKVLVYGFFQGFNTKFLQSPSGFATAEISVRENFITKYAPNGSLPYDNFIGVVSSTSIRKPLKIQPDGKIIFFSNGSYDGQANSNIGRLNPDGSLDTDFINAGIGTNGIVNNFPLCIEIQSDGKILLGGQFTVSNGLTRNRIIRLNSDGSEDTSFVIGTGFSTAGDSVNAIIQQSDGKILVGGTFTSYNGVSRQGIIRLNLDGSVDTSFNAGSDFNGVIQIIVQSNGKILIANNSSLRRLNSDGSLDTSFLIATSGGGLIFEIALQSDGKILAVGTFTSYNSLARNRIIRLNSDGSEDTSFVIGTGLNAQVNSVSVQSTGKILVGGQFTTYNGEFANRLARLNSDGSLDSSYSALLMSKASNVHLYRVS